MQQEQSEQEVRNPPPAARPPIPAGNGSLLPEQLRAPSERGRVELFILLVTFTAGWVDALAYLFLTRVFASFLTGNILFLGLSVAQSNTGLLIRALVAILSGFVGIACGTYYLQQVLQHHTKPSWRTHFVPPLLLEWLLLLAFAIVWLVTSHLSQRSDIQVLLLGLAALGMGIQAALVAAFNVPGVVANALTGTIITLGQHLGRFLVQPRPACQQWKWQNVFLVSLCLLYVIGALLVVLASASGLAPVVPVLILTVAIAALLR